MKMHNSISLEVLIGYDLNLHIKFSIFIIVVKFNPGTVNVTNETF